MYVTYIFWDWAWEAMNPELPPLRKPVNTGYVEKYIPMNVFVCYWLMLFFYVYFIFLYFSIGEQIVNKTFFFLERQIPLSVSHPLRNQDSVSISIQSNAERSKSGWRWVCLRFLLFCLFFSFPTPPLLPSLFLYLKQNYI